MTAGWQDLAIIFSICRGGRGMAGRWQPFSAYGGVTREWQDVTMIFSLCRSGVWALTGRRNKQIGAVRGGRALGRWKEAEQQSKTAR